METLTGEEHRQRHIELHRAFDELLADWLHHTRGSIKDPILELVQWSFSQTVQPNEDELTEISPK